MYSSGRTFSTACFMVRECTPMHLVPPPLAAVTHYPFLCPTTAFTIGATLVSRDRDFASISGVTVVDWTSDNTVPRSSLTIRWGRFALPARSDLRKILSSKHAAIRP